MNRLQKKCLFAATGMHLLLLVILLVGPAFLSSHSQMDDSETIDIIPPNLIDGNSFGGGPKAPASAPAPAPQQPVAQVVQPPQTSVKAEVEPPKPQSQPVEQSKPQPIVQKETPKPVKRAAESVDPKKEKTKPPLVLKPVTRSQNDAERSAQANARAQQLAAANRRAEAFRKAARSLSSGLSSSTEIETPGGFGGEGEAFANYASVVKSIYENAWIEPTDSSLDDATAKVTVTIASDGTVISARISQPSGDAQVDASVQRTLNNVKFIAPFPSGTTDKERTFIINFNLKAKRLSA